MKDKNQELVFRLQGLEEEVSKARQSLLSARTKDETLERMSWLSSAKAHLEKAYAEYTRCFQIQKRADDNIYHWDNSTPSTRIPISSNEEEDLAAYLGKEVYFEDTGLYSIEGEDNFIIVL